MDSSALAVIFAVVLLAKAQTPLKLKPSTEPAYVITAHTVIYDKDTNSQLHNYVIVYASEVLKVQYAESQIGTVKADASQLERLAPGENNLHLHHRYGRYPHQPDLTQVPPVGVPIRACEMDTQHPGGDGHPVVAIQSVSSPCISRSGDTLHYLPAPNDKINLYDYVNFDILSEKTTKK
jgi:hypothetical protein